jgi:sulfate adenylyltransferase subunit 2
METYALSVLDELEAEAIHILRETAAEFQRPAMMYSVGKDSSVLLRLAQKAFSPGRVPFPLVHVDTAFKFAEMYAFRDRVCREAGVELRVHESQKALESEANPWDLGTQRCCALLKTKGLLDAFAAGGYDALIGGARREEERSRAKERVFSFRDRHGQWDPRVQRPELWSLYNGRLGAGESMRVFPLSNWTELDIWRYIAAEKVPVVPLYFAAEREVVVRGDQLIPVGPKTRLQPGEKPGRVLCRFRTLGCYPCTGAVRSAATSIEEIIAELEQAKRSERTTRIIDFDSDGSMEQKKREGYF